jgi:hypothetical protein
LNAEPEPRTKNLEPRTSKIHTVSEFRIWRLRKLHKFVDAELKAAGEGGVEVSYYFNGELSYSRRCDSREMALAEAAAKRAELEREGWMFHW